VRVAEDGLVVGGPEAQAETVDLHVERGRGRAGAVPARADPVSVGSD
jgi:hypothetical protein